MKRKVAKNVLDDQDKSNIASLIILTDSRKLPVKAKLCSHGGSDR